MQAFLTSTGISVFVVKLENMKIFIWTSLLSREWIDLLFIYQTLKFDRIYICRKTWNEYRVNKSRLQSTIVYSEIHQLVKTMSKCSETHVH